MGLGVPRSQVTACVIAVAPDALHQSVQTVVLELIVKFVQQFHPNEFTVCPLGSQPGRPVEAMGFQQHPSAVDIVRVQRGPHPQIGHPGQGRWRQPVHQHHKNAAGGWRPVGKAQVQSSEAQFTAEFAAMHHMA